MKSWRRRFAAEDRNGRPRSRIDEIIFCRQPMRRCELQAISKLEPAPADITKLMRSRYPIVTISSRYRSSKEMPKVYQLLQRALSLKVTRDRLMIEYDKIMPEYQFASNKGYGLAEHIKVLKEIGASAIHRQSFIKNFV